MPCVVITGGPGAGKTTLLAELADRGFTTVPESARAIISERLEAGLCPRHDPVTFARKIQRRDVEKFELHRHSPDWTFFDRGVIEAIGMLHEASPLSSIEVQSLAKRFPFHPAVFVLPPWQAIYINDAERDQSYIDSARIHRAVVNWYKTTGHHIVTVQPATASQRADYVLATLSHSAV